MAKWDGMQPAGLLLPLLLNEGRVDSSLLWPQAQLCQCVEETAGNGGSGEVGELDAGGTEGASVQQSSTPEGRMSR